MAPNGEVLVSKFHGGDREGCKMLQGLKAEGLQRAMSDLSLEMKRDCFSEACKLPGISEVKEVSCECCGMTEEYTKAYIRLVRERFSGRWVCGLCSEAVKEEMKKVGGKEEALQAHMSACATFNRIGRTQPVLHQAEAMRELYKKWSLRRKKKGGIMRTSSCITAFSKGPLSSSPEPERPIGKKNNN